jgi:glucose/arabinose dehydrogenase
MAAAFMLAVVLAATAACGGSSGGMQPPPPVAGPVAFREETYLAGLETPVVMAFAPDGRLFFGELRSGRVRIAQNGMVSAQDFVVLPVKTDCECGVLGLALDPDFAANRLVYIYHSHPDGKHRLLRFRDDSGAAADQAILLDDLPLTTVHNAGRIAFGHDGHLYLTIGDLVDPATAQDPTSLGGKLHRFRKDGAVPADNPFGVNPAYAMGLRNSFGLAFHPATGTPYVSDNGPQCDDRLVRIVRGGNHGWRPGYPCGDTDPGFVAPILRFADRIAPTGITFYTGSTFPQFRNGLFLTDFLHGRLRHFQIDENDQGRVLAAEVVVEGGYGALYDVKEGPDGYIYFSGDNAIVRLVPQ